MKDFPACASVINALLVAPNGTFIKLTQNVALFLKFFRFLLKQHYLGKQAFHFGFMLVLKLPDSALKCQVL